eukprot:CAMPEP_0118871148 /NCGR_PEP_ID=MMETSP1163-20130328/13840_1 /TAXON_ID=124430 /ORGANISM="Phaeomonas parva, Strain CCMP2877" /LENGTH=273 /DNA_ID=CAMNT_0006806227 /DNA_START=251 /DNA_END=1072 /DNA_ORIENTATION=+
MMRLVSLALVAGGVSGFAVLPSGGRRSMSLAAGAAGGEKITLLFDCDGVLAETERDGHRVAFNQAFGEFDIACDWDVDLYGKLLEVGGGKERMTAHWNEVGWPAGYDDEEKRVELVKALHLRKTEIFMDMLKRGEIPLRPGVEPLIKEAVEGGLKVAVCSTSNEKAVATLVETLLTPYAPKIPIYAGDMVAKKKPAPDVYNMAATELGVDPKSCMVFEDTAIGLQAATAAGMACTVTKSIYTENEDFTGAVRVLGNLEGTDLSACDAALKSTA